MTVSQAYRNHVEELMRRYVQSGDEFALRSLSCMSLLAEGWRYGDPDPTDGPDNGGGEVIELRRYREVMVA